MLPHRSDTSRGHLHPPTRPRLSLPPFASLFLSSFPSDVRLELTSRTIAGVVSPVRPLMPPLSWGRLRKLPFPFPSPPFLPSPRLCNYQDPLATLSSRRIARRCNGHCLRVKSFDPRRNDTPPEVVAWCGRLHDFWNFRSYDRELLRWRCAREDRCIRWARESGDRGRFARLRVKTPFRSVRVYSNEGFPEMFHFALSKRYRKIACSFYCCHYVAFKYRFVVFNYDKASLSFESRSRNVQFYNCVTCP